MGLITVDAVRQRAKSAMRFSMNKSAASILKEAETFAEFTSHTFDIFLSHRRIDEELVLGLKGYLEDFGFSVYVDWIHDKQLNRTAVSADTAATLKERMNRATSLLYASTDNASDSVWMPWELGYFDGKKDGRVAVLPLATYYHPDDVYQGQEYLGLYPYVVNTTGSGLWVHRSKDKFVSFKNWMAGSKV